MDVVCNESIYQVGRQSTPAPACHLSSLWLSERCGWDTTAFSHHTRSYNRMFALLFMSYEMKPTLTFISAFQKSRNRPACCFVSPLPCHAPTTHFVIYTADVYALVLRTVFSHSSLFDSRTEIAG